MKGRRLAIGFLIGFATLSCSFDQKRNKDYPGPYRFGKPDRVYRLSRPLNEISGLAMRDSTHLVAINDEEGVIFDFNLNKGQIQDEWPFGENRDYEGIALDGSTAFVVESDGDVFEVSDYQHPQRQTRKHENLLEAGNNVEGLCYDAEAHALLLACKDDPGTDEEGEKAVYAYDLAANSMQSQQPYFTVNLHAVEDSLLQTGLDGFSNELRKAFTFDEDQEDLFRPSGIARHPLTGDLYILSANYRMMVVLDNQHRLKHIIPFENPLFRQPEGIAFRKDGDVFISNEANEGTPNILHFSYP